MKKFFGLLVVSFVSLLSFFACSIQNEEIDFDQIASSLKDQQAKVIVEIDGKPFYEEDRIFTGSVMVASTSIRAWPGCWCSSPSGPYMTVWTPHPACRWPKSTSARQGLGHHHSLVRLTSMFQTSAGGAWIVVLTESSCMAVPFLRPGPNRPARLRSRRGRSCAWSSWR